MKRLLVANRGEIAVRIIRAARERGIETVAAYSEADKDALHVRMADSSVCVGPAPAPRSYLNIDSIVAGIKSSGADAVHPGYGFLSENADFADAVLATGATWVGPAPESIRRMGDKVAARLCAEQARVPTVPGSTGEVRCHEEAAAAAEVTGYPLAIKAAAGGGGRGIRVVETQAELEPGISTAQAEARAAFGSDAVYLERFIPTARHIEVQVFGDGERAVHLGIRDCSVQRRRQKVVEEAGMIALPDKVVAEMTSASVRLAEAAKYRGAGTVEFLYDESRGEFYFIEMNTRIQVEHPVTELVYGRDLVAEQLRVASGASLTWQQQDLIPRGHAIEIRVNAENASQNFMPSPGTLSTFVCPSGPFVRVDTGVQAGDVVSPFYDSMIAKLIVWAEDRPRALARMLGALDEFRVDGIRTTIGFVRSVIDTETFRRGTYHTTWLEERMQQQIAEDAQ